IDTRGWADDLGESRPPIEAPSPAPPPPPPEPTPPPRPPSIKAEPRRSKKITVPPPPNPDVDSLEEILEPERPVAMMSDKTEKNLEPVAPAAEVVRRNWPVIVAVVVLLIA